MLAAPELEWNGPILCLVPPSPLPVAGYYLCSPLSELEWNGAILCLFPPGTFFAIHKGVAADVPRPSPLSAKFLSQTKVRLSRFAIAHSPPSGLPTFLSFLP